MKQLILDGYNVIHELPLLKKNLLLSFLIDSPKLKTRKINNQKSTKKISPAQEKEINEFLINKESAKEFEIFVL